MKKGLACLVLCFALGLLGAGCGEQPVPVETEAPTRSTVPEITEEPETVPETTEAAQTVPEATQPLSVGVESLGFDHKGQQAVLSVGDEEAEWYSDDVTVALVHEGTVIAMGPGETTVHAVCGGREATIQIRCTADPAEPKPILAPAILRSPQRRPPEVTEDVSGYFDDVVFMGDSTSYSLYKWEIQNDVLGDAEFLARGSVSIFSLLNGSKKYFHEGVEKSPEDAIRDTGRGKLYVMLGVNDVPRIGTEETMKLWEELLDRILEKSPDLEVYIQSLTPIRVKEQGEPYFTNEEFDRYNRALEAFALENGFHYVPIAHYFKDNENGLVLEYSYDKVHANEAGNAVWAQAIREYVAQEMKREVSP